MASRHASCWCTLRPVTAIHVAFRAEGMSIGPSLLSAFGVPFGRDANPDTGGKLPEHRDFAPRLILLPPGSVFPRGGQDGCRNWESGLIHREVKTWLTAPVTVELTC